MGFDREKGPTMHQGQEGEPVRRTRRRPARRQRRRLFDANSNRPPRAGQQAIVESLEQRALLAAPSITLSGQALATYALTDPTARFLDGNIGVSGGAANFGGGSLTLSLAPDAAGAGRLDITPGGGISLGAGNAVQFDPPGSDPPVTIGTVSGRGTRNLGLALTNAANAGSVQALLRRVTYQNDAPSPPKQVHVDYALRDSAAGEAGEARQTIAVHAVDLKATISAGASTVLAGDPATYTLRVHNAGPGTATGVRLAVTLPASSLAALDDAGGGTLDGNTLTFNLPDLGDDATATRTIRLRPTAEAGTAGSIAVSAVATSNQGELAGGDSDSVTTTVKPGVDLTIDVSDAVDPVAAGQNLTYLVRVENRGPSTAANTRVVATLPAGVVFVSATGQGTRVGNEVRFDVGDLPNGGVVALSYTVRPTSATGTISTTARVTSNTDERNPDDNADTETTTINAAADLRVSIAGSPGSVSVNGVLTYTITVTNDGPSAATPRVTVTLPALDLDGDGQPDFRDINTGGGMRADNVVTFSEANLGSLASGDSITRTIRITPTVGAANRTLATTALVASTVADPNPLNNAARVDTLVAFSLQVTDPRDTAAGVDDIPETLRYAINLANEHRNVGGPDVIEIATTLSGSVVTLLRALPAITDPVILRFAAGGGRLGIDADCLATIGAVLMIEPGGAGSTIQDLALFNYTDVGLWLQGGNNTILNTYVGLDADGNTPTCQGRVGILIDGSSGNTIGSGAGDAARNVIALNTVAGIRVAGGSNNAILGNRIGTSPDGAHARANGVGVLVAGGSGTTIGGASAGAGTGVGNIIAGNSGAGIAVQVRATADAPTRIQGNLIGATLGPGDSLSALANAVGIAIDAAAHVAIGGTAQGAGNSIAGNSGAGVHIDAGSTNVTLAGNSIGRTSAGEALALGNAQGVLVAGVAAGSAILVGGTDPGSRNVISGNRDAGVELRGGARDVRIQGNWIGLNAAGTGALGNGADGAGADPGILLGASSNTLVGGTTDAARNVISGNAGAGIQVTSSATATIQGNWIGLSAFGTALERSNGGAGVLLDGTTSAAVGGTDAAARNVISGNAGAGVKVTGANLAGILIAGNFIGTDPLGNGGIGNAVGVRIDAATGLDLGDRAGTPGVEPANVIAGNKGAGVLITGASSDIRVRGNRIGTTADGRGALANAGAGVEIQAGTNIHVGGTDAAARNVISGNGAGGVLVRPAPGGAIGVVRIMGNVIGTDLDGATPLGNAVAGVHIAGASGVAIGGDAAGARNVISGNSGDGVWITGAGAKGNTLHGNLIGTNAGGTLGVGNRGAGVRIDGGARGNVVGGLTPRPGEGLGNVISGNGGAGVALSGAGTSDNQVLGNLIGTAAGGRSDLGNAGSGVQIVGAPRNTIGGTKADARNVLSGNGGSGVWINGAGATGNNVRGNVIGTDASGSAALRNANDGVLIDGGAVGNVVGLDTTSSPARGAGNLISGNAESGVRLAGGATGNIVAGNRIGTNADGSAALGNAGSGVLIEGAFGNTIGGANEAARNVLSGNGGDGVQLRALASANNVAGNFIGLGADGASPLPNAGSGVGVSGGAHSNTVGGDGPASKNRIAHNTVGILVADPAPNGLGNVFRFNEILSSRSDGVQVLNGAARQVFEQNHVQGNAGNGFSILASGLNTIGAGNVITGNSLHGVQVSGPAAALNVITYNIINNNTLYGVFISNAPRNTIDGNQVLGNGSHGVVIQGGTAVGNAVSGNLVTGNNGSGVVVLDGQENAIDFNRIGANQGSGVALIAVVNTVAANRVGWNEIGADPIGGNRDYGLDVTNSSGNTVVGNAITRNGLGGVHVFGAQASGNTIGAPDDDPARPGRNVIAANALDGVKVEDAPGTRVVNNEIRANAGDGVELSGRATTGSVVSGNRVLDNRLDGVRVVSAPRNTIGPGNTISGNAQAGVEVTGQGSKGTTILGNFIGTQEGGRAKRGNRVGVLLTDTTEITVGGAAPLVLRKTPDLASANIIAGNTQTGIQVSGTGTTGINIRNNLIGLGLDASGQGTRFLGNGAARSGRNTQVGGDGVGVWIVDARSTTVRGNFLSGNDLAGVHIQGRRAVGNVVERNWIGVDTRGRTPYETTANSGARLVAAFQRASNQGSGVLLNATSGNLVGGSRTSRGNRIAGNDVGVRIIGDTSRPAGGRGNRILNNTIERNEFGVFLDNAPDATLTGNAISGNISIGLAIRGSRATGNLVASNAIDANRGQTDFPLGAARSGRVKKDVGTGIYIEGASANTIQDNSIRGNALAGLYFFGGASGNGVRRNTITEFKDARGRVARGQYGVLLFNSASNVFAIVRRGKDANVLSGSRLANFREFTGPRTDTLVLLPGETLPRGPNTLLRRDARRG